MRDEVKIPAHVWETIRLYMETVESQRRTIASLLENRAATNPPQNKPDKPCKVIKMLPR
jgi:hypothetical protein